MKKFYGLISELLGNSRWQDCLLLGASLFTGGLLLGTLAANGKKTIKILSAVAFVATTLPLLVKYLRIAADFAKSQGLLPSGFRPLRGGRS